jgi:hypothetical protein
MKLTGKYQVLGEKPVPVPQQIPHGLTRDRTRASAVRDKRLTSYLLLLKIIKTRYGIDIRKLKDVRERRSVTVSRCHGSPEGTESVRGATTTMAPANLDVLARKPPVFVCLRIGNGRRIYKIP